MMGVGPGVCRQCTTPNGFLEPSVKTLRCKSCVSAIQGAARYWRGMRGPATSRRGSRSRSLVPRAHGALTQVQEKWDCYLNALHVTTPDPGIDLMLNRWLVYQVLACRLWARSAFYQSGGAYGFRDQLQDVMALVYSAPAEARAQILRSAARQFEEGDVQHWWHPPSGV